jgi:hypothetical protein
MTSSKLPADLARSRLDKRAQEQVALSNNITPKRLLKSPSQKKSERAKAKELKRAGVANAPEVRPPEDCRNCPKEPCGSSLSKCGVIAITGRCSKCGGKYLRRSIANEVFVCKVCRGEV